jgi:hypothetical protein
MLLDFASVYREAIAASSEARDRRDAALQGNDAAFVETVKRVRTSLLESILSDAPSKIAEAAAAGRSTADVYRFNGNDYINDISVLWLLKGHRLGTPCAPPPPGTPGPLLPDIQAAMAPFGVLHDWDGVTGGNRIVARWV